STALPPVCVRLYRCARSPRRSSNVVTDSSSVFIGTQSLSPSAHTRLTSTVCTSTRHVNDTSPRGQGPSTAARQVVAVGTVLLTLVAACARGDATRKAVNDSGKTTQ